VRFGSNVRSGALATEMPSWIRSEAQLVETAPMPKEMRRARARQCLEMSAQLDCSEIGGEDGS